MARPSRNTDKLLLRAGRKLLPKTGIRELSLRKVAAEAGVNLGMFHYHFKSKRAFVRLVLQEFYEEFFEGFTAESGGEAPPLERLARALTALARFGRDNRELLLAIIRGILEGDPEAARFAGANVPRHLSILAELMAACQKEGSLRPMPLQTAVAFLAGGVIGPCVALGVCEAAVSGRAGVQPLKGSLASDESIRVRVDAALRGLRRGP